MVGTLLDGEVCMGWLISLLLAAALVAAAWPDLAYRPDRDAEPEADLGFAADGDEAGDADGEGAGLFSVAFVRGRLIALEAELDRLDRDEEMFARAFHLGIARSVYKDLQVEEARLSEELRPVEVGAVVVGELDDAWSSSGRREVLDL